MMSCDSMRRLAMRPGRVLALAGVGLGVLTFAVALSSRGDSAEPKKAAPTAKGKAEEAPTGYDDPPVSNGYTTKDEFLAARDTFMEDEDTSKGLGPVYNATSCVACHQNPIVGGSSQIVE